MEFKFNNNEKAWGQLFLNEFCFPYLEDTVVTKDLGDVYLENIEEGIEFIFDEEDYELTTIIFKGKEQEHSFKKGLPFKYRFGLSQEEVLGLLESFIIKALQSAFLILIAAVLIIKKSIQLPSSSPSICKE